MKKNETGRTMVEIVSVLVIMGILSVVGVAWYVNVTRQQKIEAVLNTLRMKTVEVSAALNGRQFDSIEEENKFLAGFKGYSAGYVFSFRASDDGDGFVTELSYLNREPVKGRMCRELITEMSKQQFVSDVSFTLNNEEMEDGSKQDLTVPLNGQYVDLEAVCGG